MNPFLITEANFSAARAPALATTFKYQSSSAPNWYCSIFLPTDLIVRNEGGPHAAGAWPENIDRVAASVASDSFAKSLGAAGLGQATPRGSDENKVFLPIFTGLVQKLLCIALAHAKSTDRCNTIYKALLAQRIVKLDFVPNETVLKEVARHLNVATALLDSQLSDGSLDAPSNYGAPSYKTLLKADATHSIWNVLHSAIYFGWPIEHSLIVEAPVFRKFALHVLIITVVCKAFESVFNARSLNWRKHVDKVAGDLGDMFGVAPAVDMKQQLLNWERQNVVIFNNLIDAYYNPVRKAFAWQTINFPPTENNEETSLLEVIIAVLGYTGDAPLQLLNQEYRDSVRYYRTFFELNANRSFSDPIIPQDKLMSALRQNRQREEDENDIIVITVKQENAVESKPKRKKQ
jgi:hypothetical protein